MRSAPMPKEKPRAGAGGPPEPPGSPDDAALVRAVRAGDREAFGTLVARHGGALVRFARVFLRDPSAAEEVVQDAWLAALEGLDRFEGRASFRTWLFRILANRARTRATREGRSVPLSALEPAEGDEGVDPSRFRERGHWADPPSGWREESPERLAVLAETRGILEAAIAELPEGQKAVIVLRDVEGMETEEICNLLDITETNQRVLLHRARTRVRAALERYLRGRS